MPKYMSLRDQKSHFECPFDFITKIMFMDESWGQLLSTNHTNTGKTGDSSCKYVMFYKCVHYISAKIILVSSASIFVDEWLQRQGHFWVWPLYILSKCDVRHRLHCFVSTDIYLYNLTKGKPYRVIQRWRRSTCLRHHCWLSFFFYLFICFVSVFVFVVLFLTLLILF